MNNTILFLDFDLTITTTHSTGHPSKENKIHTDKIYEVLSLLKQQGYTLIIVSRGIQEKISQYVSHFMPSIFDEVYGASDDTELNKGNIYWANKKVDIVHSCLRSINPTYAYFFDDTILNCEQMNTKLPKVNTKLIINNLDKVLIDLFIDLSIFCHFGKFGDILYAFTTNPIIDRDYSIKLFENYPALQFIIRPSRFSIIDSKIFALSTRTTHHLLYMLNDGIRNFDDLHFYYLSPKKDIEPKILIDFIIGNDILYINHLYLISVFGKTKL